MNVTEGQGVSGGVEYTYALGNYLWYAVYECRAHCCLLEEEGRTLLTEQFEVHGYHWRIRLRRRGSHLSAYLQSNNVMRVTVQLAFTSDSSIELVNVPSAGGRCTFRWFGDEWGYNHFATISEIHSASSDGHTENSFFTVRMEMRIQNAENESSALTVDNESATYIWNLRYVRGMGPSRLATEEISVENMRLRLMLYLDGQKTRSGDPTIYLCNLGSHSILVKCRFTVINGRSSQMDKVEEHTFAVNADSAKRKGKLLEMKDLEDETLGFVSNGWLTIIAEITHLRKEYTSKFWLTIPKLQSWTTKILRRIWGEH